MAGGGVHLHQGTYWLRISLRSFVQSTTLLAGVCARMPVSEARVRARTRKGFNFSSQLSAVSSQLQRATLALSFQASEPGTQLIAEG